MADDVLQTITLLGAAQGFFLAVLLATRQSNSAANKILALIMFVFSVDLVTTVFYASDYEIAYPQLIGLTHSIPLLYGPLFYFYVRLITRNKAVRWKSVGLHFLPFLLVTLLLVPFFLESGSEKLKLLTSPSLSSWDEPLTLLNHVIFAHSLGYIIAIFEVLRRHRNRIRDTYSTLDRINLNWLNRMLVGGSIMWCIALFFHIIGLVYTGTEQGYNPIEGYGDYVSLGTAAYIYICGYLGLRQPEIFSQATLEAGPPVEEEPSKPSYSKSGMSDEQADVFAAEVVRFMTTQKPYRNSTLTLAELADQIGMSSHNLSEVINRRLGQNFYDFVNGYRVREVQGRITDPANAHLTLLALALDSGFNSKSSFNAVFKRHTGMTPSQYQKANLVL